MATITIFWTRNKMHRRSIFLVLALAVALSASLAAQAPASRWFKGNTHTHTNKSDGDSSPEAVVEWYKNHRYDFVVLTDHEYLNAVDELNSKFAADGKFLVIQGQEVTDRWDKKPFHVNGLGMTKVVMPNRATGAALNLQKNVDGVREAGGIAQINHPNFGWAITVGDLLQVKGASLVEIYSGHPLVNMIGGGGSPSVEEMWDSVLSQGRIYYGVAVDDSHHFMRPGDVAAATPGHGWVVVRANELSARAILAALERGDFYASNGVELDDYSTDARQITITIKEKKGSRYRTQFIGDGGRVLADSITSPAVYRFRGNESYVRARILESNGKMAWTQPVFRKRR
jgi:hypothetical protein